MAVSSSFRRCPGYWAGSSVGSAVAAQGRWTRNCTAASAPTSVEITSASSAAKVASHKANQMILRQALPEPSTATAVGAATASTPSVGETAVGATASKCAAAWQPTPEQPTPTFPRRGAAIAARPRRIRFAATKGTAGRAVTVVTLAVAVPATMASATAIRSAGSPTDLAAADVAGNLLDSVATATSVRSQKGGLLGPTGIQRASWWTKSGLGTIAVAASLAPVSMTACRAAREMARPVGRAAELTII